MRHTTVVKAVLLRTSMHVHKCDRLTAYFERRGLNYDTRHKLGCVATLKVLNSLYVKCAQLDGCVGNRFRIAIQLKLGGGWQHLL